MPRLATSLILTLLILLAWQGLASEEYLQVKDQVRFAKAWLELSPKLEDFPNPEIGPDSLEQRKAEIRSRIVTLLATTREAYRTDKIRVLGYNAERGALAVDDSQLNLHHYFSMPAPVAKRISANSRSWYLTGYRQLNWDLDWDYMEWELKGPEQSYPEQPEPVYTIPPRLSRDEFSEGIPDPTEKLLATDPPSYLAYQSYLSGDYQSSLSGFENAYQASGQANPIYCYWIARNHLALGNTAQATYWLKLYQRTGNEVYASQAKAMNEIIDRQYHIFRSVDRMPLNSELSSPGGESHFTIHPLSGDLYFSSGRSAEFNGSNIWRAPKSGDSWGTPELVKELCSNADEALCSFSKDGGTAWLSGKYESGRRDFDILFSTRQDSLWQVPTMIRELSSSYDDIDPWLHDDRVMIFSSSRPGGYGGFDLWYSEFIGGSWQIPVNMGAAVNTSGDEDSPSLGLDGKTLYFSSNGYPGLGEADLFKAVKLQSGWLGWSLPENLGSVINSPARERRFLQLKDSNQALRVSTRAGIPYAELLLLEFAPRSYWSQNEHGYAVWQYDPDKVSPLTGTIRMDMLSDPGYYRITASVTSIEGLQLRPEIRITYILDAVHYLKLARPNQLGFYELELPLAPSYRVDCSLEGYSDYSVQIKPGAESSRHLDVEMKR